MNNKYSYSLIIAVALVLLTSCDSGFNEVNSDDTKLTSLKPSFQLNEAIISSAIGYNNLQYEEIIVRQMMNPFSGLGAAAQYNVINKPVASDNWDRYYGSVKEIADVLAQTEDDSAISNVYNMARIWRAYNFMVLTDSYGDVPYSEAGKAFLEGIVFPKYDDQKSIYVGDQGILEELASASKALDPSKPSPTDVLYEGDVTKWKHLGYSLLLRGAMRLTKVQPEMAKKYVDIAVSGGLMQSNNESAVLRHTSNYTNPIGEHLSGGQGDFFYIDRVFINYLQNNNDPRLGSIAVRYVNAESGADQVEDFAERSPIVQIGMPQGYDNTNISEAVEEDGISSVYAYSQIDKTKMANPQAPTFYITYAQTQLLLAEAVVRGWAQGDAASLYVKGIKAHMKQFEEYGETAVISQSDINDYLQAHTLDLNLALKQINTQYWVVSYLNGPEVWANFRRSGYPNVPKNPLSGDLNTEDFIRRLPYPDGEFSVNEDNVEQAINSQGPDNLDTRVWWDVVE